MGYKVIYRGLEVICDTFEDLDALADHQDGSSKAKPARTDGVSPQRSFEPKAKTIKEFVSGLSANPKKFLRALVKADDHKLMDGELRGALGFENNMQLSGVISTMYRDAQKAGIEREDILVRWVVSNDPKNKIVEYAIPSSAIQQVREGLVL